MYQSLSNTDHVNGIYQQYLQRITVLITWGKVTNPNQYRYAVESGQGFLFIHTHNREQAKVKQRFGILQILLSEKKI
jgi:hypothetical protein